MKKGWTVLYLQPDPLPRDGLSGVRKGCEALAAAAISADCGSRSCALWESAPLAAAAPGACKFHAEDELPDWAGSLDHSSDSDQPPWMH